MRMRVGVVVGCAVVAWGCSVEVGEGTIAPMAVDEPIDAATEVPPLSLSMEMEFLSSDQSAAIADQYSSKLGAVEAIDVDVKALGVIDDDGVTVPGSGLVVAFEGVTLDHAGQRVRLPSETKKKVITTIKQRSPLTLPIQVTVDWPETTKSTVTAHAIVQPIFLVNALEAL
jgi:hypothetical protein